MGDGGRREIRTGLRGGSECSNRRGVDSAVAIETRRRESSVSALPIGHCVTVHGFGLCDEADWLGQHALHLCQERSFFIREHDMNAHRLWREWEPPAMAEVYSL
jgi:hypothetical protein